MSGFRRHGTSRDTPGGRAIARTRRKPDGLLFGSVTASFPHDRPIMKEEKPMSGLEPLTC
ncbi:MAG: hypothetical protein D6812_11440 [Deltaproteobacteria bacterium]|nr:MAG: hypothetical protein D6812_11440 [Deltaproteobacteria bacterium]